MNFKPNLVLRAVIPFLVAASLLAAASNDEPLSALIARADSASSSARPSLYAEIAERRLKEADLLYTDGKNEEAREAVNDVVTYSEKAADACTHASSKLKNTEISLRKMAAKLRDIRRTLPFEEQAPVQAAAEQLERFRSELLTRMFGKGQK